MMTKKIFSHEADNYTLYGSLFGTLFPILATFIESYRSFKMLNIDSMIRVQSENPLLWIIDTAPLFLGLFARMGGIRQDKVNAYTSTLEQEIRIRTADLRSANLASNAAGRDPAALLARCIAEGGVADGPATLVIRKSVSEPGVSDAEPIPMRYSSPPAADAANCKQKSAGSSKIVCSPTSRSSSDCG